MMDVLYTWQMKSTPGDKEGTEVSKQAPSLASGRWAVCCSTWLNLTAGFCTSCVL